MIYLEPRMQSPYFNTALNPQLLSTIKNVDNAIRLFVFDNMKSLHELGTLSEFNGLFGNRPFEKVLSTKFEEDNEKQMHSLFLDYLKEYEESMLSNWEKEELQEPLVEIYFLIHQAYIQFEKSSYMKSDEVRPAKEKFEHYFWDKVKCRYGYDC